MAEPVHRWNAGVLGHPIAHSKSPDLHAAAYRVLGLDIDYRAHDVTPEQLRGFVSGLGDTAAAGTDWLGLSVTMPLKAATTFGSRQACAIAHSQNEAYIG